MKLTIIKREDEDGERQKVDVMDESGKIIASVNTQADSPEDNTCNRLGIANFAISIASAAGAEVELQDALYGD